MALDAVGLQQPLRYTVDLKEGLVQQPMSSQLMKGDKKANRVIVRITNGSETVDLAGVGVSGSFIRPPDEAELTLSGSVNGNEAVIVLDDLCYAEEGYCEIDVKLTVNGVSRTVLALTGYVLAKGNGAYIDVGNVIPNIDDIIAQYDEMKAVTERTLAAAQRAEALAINASGYAGDSNKLGGKTWAERMLEIYPIGSIYMSVNSTSPASLFGGTWEMIHDRFLLAAGPNYSAGSTGGNSEILIEANNLPEHTHTIVTTSNSGDLSGNGNMLKLPADYGATSNGQGNTAASTNTNVTAKNPVSIMPPYLAVYTWKRVS